jgi:hypothetical protein
MIVRPGQHIFYLLNKTYEKNKFVPNDVGPKHVSDGLWKTK